MDSGEVTQWLDGIVSNVGTPITLLELLKKQLSKSVQQKQKYHLFYSTLSSSFLKLSINNAHSSTSTE